MLSKKLSLTHFIIKKPKIGLLTIVSGELYKKRYSKAFEIKKKL